MVLIFEIGISHIIKCDNMAGYPKSGLVNVAAMVIPNYSYTSKYNYVIIFIVVTVTYIHYTTVL